jgi:acyl-CoA dehydrogenase
MTAKKLSTDMSFSDEQAMLLETASEFFKDKSPTAIVRDLMISDHGYATDVWQEMVQLGWSGLAVPEGFGGSGLGIAAAVCIAEPMGRHLSATPWLPTQLAIQGLLAADEDLQNAYLPSLAEGAIGSVALSEVGGAWDLTQAELAVTIDVGEIILNGTKVFVLNADVAEVLLVSGLCNGKPCLAVLDQKDISGCTLNRETVIDETRRSFELTLANVKIPKSRLIDGARALHALQLIQSAAQLLISAESAGGIAGTLALVVDYLNTREAFGRKIGGYQGLKHPTVDILIGLERTRSHVYHAASLIDSGQDASIALGMAKAEASDSFAFAGDRAIQFHGGFGFTWDCDAQLYLRRALWAQYAFGDGVYHRKHLAAAFLSD